jgi:hypothetical protein
MNLEPGFGAAQHESHAPKCGELAMTGAISLLRSSAISSTFPALAPAQSAFNPLLISIEQQKRENQTHTHLMAYRY